MKISQVILFYIVFVLIMAVPPVVLGLLGYTAIVANGFWTVFFFMSGLTFIVLMIMVSVSNKNESYFSQAFLGGTTLKIIASLIFIMIFVRKNNVNKVFFMADFVYIYLLNTAFEVYVLLRTLRLKNLR